MNESEQLSVVMALIMHGGDAKGKAIEAIRAAKQYDFDRAEAKLAEAQEALNTAHRSQTGLLTQEAAGNSIPLSLLMVHGQDHLMTALTFIDIAKELVDVYRELHHK